MNEEPIFESIVACTSSGNKMSIPFSEDFQLDEDDCERLFIRWNEIHFYGVPNNISDADYENFCDGNYSKEIKLGKVFGCCILCSKILEAGFDPVDICDAAHADLEYTMSAMTEEGPLKEDIFADVYYIHELNMESDFDNAQYKQKVLELLPMAVLNLFCTYPDYLAFYPEPLPYAPDIAKQEQCQRLQQIAADKIDSTFGFATTESDNRVLKFSDAYQLDDNEIKMVMRRRVPGQSYPKEAKDKNEFSLYEGSGFQEVGETRLLCKRVKFSEMTN